MKDCVGGINAKGKGKKKGYGEVKSIKVPTYTYEDSTRNPPNTEKEGGEMEM
jgi:hypothetical protein